MSLRKPIIKVTRECVVCSGKGQRPGYRECKFCNGIGKIDVKQNDPKFKKYYIKNLEEVIEYYTGSYREKNEEAQEYLKKVKEYCKELDKIVNK